MVWGVCSKYKECQDLDVNSTSPAFQTIKHHNHYNTLIQPSLLYQLSLLSYQPQQPILKMKTTSILITLLSAMATASPTLRRQIPQIPSVTFSLINDITGANVPIPVLADGLPVRFGDAFAGTNLDKNGIVTATSGQLVTLDKNVRCVVNNGVNEPWKLNAENTFVDLDGVDGAVETNVNDFVLICEF
jgi:hypothetical protein